MKVYVSVDMEGVTGVTTATQCTSTHPDYHRFRKLMTLDANAAVEGAFESGATEVVVNDSHSSQTNILIEELHPAARLISGSNKHLGQMEGIDGSFGAVFFVGYHQGEGLGDGVLNHTHVSATMNDVRVNDVVVDEAAINAGIAGAFGVPVALVAGDDAVCADAQERFEDIEVAPVKIAIDRFATNSLSPQEGQARIRASARAAVEKARAGVLAPYVVDSPVTFTVEFKNTASAHICTLFPSVERRGPRTVSVTAHSYLDCFRQYWGLILLGLHAKDGIIQ